MIKTIKLINGVCMSIFNLILISMIALIKSVTIIINAIVKKGGGEK